MVVSGARWHPCDCVRCVPDYAEQFITLFGKVALVRTCLKWSGNLFLVLVSVEQMPCLWVFMRQAEMWWFIILA